MTDFVNRLLGRSGLPPIRPVLPSLFEPFARARDESPLPMGEITSGSPQQTVPPARASAAAAIVGPVPPRSAPADPPVTRTTEVRQDVSVFHPVQRIEKVTEVVPPPSRPAIPDIHPVSLPARTAPGADPVPVMAQVRLVHPLVPDPAPPIVVRTTHLVQSLVQPIPPTPVPAPPVVVRTTHPVQSLVPPIPPMPVPAPSVPVAARVEPAPEPSVRISIGRVEVRAAADIAPAPRKEQRKQPVLSLDDYLRRHVGGGGR